MAPLYVAVLFSTGLSGLGYKKKWLTPAASLTAWPVGFFITLAGYSYWWMLMTFFVTGSVATKLTAKARKAKTKRQQESAPAPTKEGKDGVAHDDHDAKVGRSPMQVLATGGIPTVLCALSSYIDIPESQLFPAILGYFACCCGDTLASEVGQLLGGRPVLVTTLRDVPPGRDGAVSFRGVTASIVGGGLIGLMGFSRRSLIAGAVLGWLGSYVDSILGAVLQSPGLSFNSGNGEINWKGWNSIVNLISSVLTSMIGIYLWNTSAHVQVCVVLALTFFTMAVAIATARNDEHRQKRAETNASA